MTKKQRALHEAAKLNLAIFRSYDNPRLFHVDAPYGFVFSEGLHYMVCDSWEDILTRISDGIEKCEDTECDVCHPEEGPNTLTAAEYAEWMNWELILDSPTFTKHQTISIQNQQTIKS